MTDLDYERFLALCDEEEEDDEELLFDETVALLLGSNVRSRRRFWVHDTIRRRQELGEYHRLIRELEFDDVRFKEYFHMNSVQFNTLLNIIQDDLKKKKTTYRKPISPRERLAITIRYLATGDAFNTIAFSYRVGSSTVAKIVKETCDVIWMKLQPVFMPAPTTEHWDIIASDFLKFWQFPNCVGAIDGKHVNIQAPPNSGTLYRNYKGFFSIVLLAVVDARKCFTVIDVGGFGKNSDGGILKASVLGQSLESDSLNLPPAKPLPGCTEPMPHVLVGDEAFPLRTNLMRPYPGAQTQDSPSKRIFNYRLSRARNVVENAFGILSARWGIYKRRLHLHPDNADKVVRASCVLHNFVQKHQPYDDIDVNNVDLDASTLAHGGSKASRVTYDIRDKFKDYFISEHGAVPWQQKKILRGFTFS